MIYLDYAANTPVDQAVLDSFVQASTTYIANPNASHQYGKAAKERMQEAIGSIASLLEVMPEEIILTSGASEANNLAIKGIVNTTKQVGKHIISTGLEHSSVSATLTYLQSQGYEIDFVMITPDGSVDLEHLKELMRQDTILVTIGYVDSEVGIEQPMEAIAAIVKEYPNCRLHTDATQAVGKIPVKLDGVDLVSFAPHKFFGLNGCGVLVKKTGIELEPVIHGGASTTVYRSGTPDLAMAVATQTALELAYANMQQRITAVSKLNDKLRQAFKGYKQQVRINSTERSIPFTLNVSVKGIKAEMMRQLLEEEGFLVSTKSACSVLTTPSRSVLEVTKDRKAAMSSFRISMSHLTTEEEIEQVLQAIDSIIKKQAK